MEASILPSLDSLTLSINAVVLEVAQMVLGVRLWEKQVLLIKRRPIRIRIASSIITGRQSPPVATQQGAISERQAACRRRICRCLRAASNFRSRSAWISGCRPANMSFGVM